VPGRIDEKDYCPPDSDNGKISIIYTTPSRQFPTGISLSLPRFVASLVASPERRVVSVFGGTPSWSHRFRGSNEVVDHRR
jgi:hypothetical protein